MALSHVSITARLHSLYIIQGGSEVAEETHSAACYRLVLSAWCIIAAHSPNRLLRAAQT